MRVSFQYFFYVIWLITLGFLESSCLLTCNYFNVTECANGRSCGEDVNKNMTCPPDTSSAVHSCFAVWKKDRNSSQEFLQHKGCFLNNEHCQTINDSCTATDQGKANEMTNSVTFFCCCQKDSCNRIHKWDPIEVPSTTVKPPPEPEPRASSTSILLFVLVPVFFVTCIAGVIFKGRRRFLAKPSSASSPSQTKDQENALDESDSTQSLPITLVEVKASGRFGQVWKASMAGEDSHVAVKILPLREKASWNIEKEIYSLPLMQESQHVLRFICARQQTEGDNRQLWLVSEFIEYGSLYDYLKGNTLEWSELLQIAITMCNGLAFLHDEMDGGSKGNKPAVAHRDFKSKNVLLRPDLSSVVTDFGLAHIFHPTKPVGTCHGQVGTRRYMAPEVLEGAVSFTRDNFKRIDMYACGLVLWELASRCCAQQGPVGDYRLPFEEFIGQQPTLEEMQDVVVNQRKRPTIRNDWLNHPGLSILSQVLDHSWDQDAEARISPSCIVERLKAIGSDT